LILLVVNYGLWRERGRREEEKTVKQQTKGITYMVMCELSSETGRNLLVDWLGRPKAAMPKAKEP
jgi:hypothetical protein